MADSAALPCPDGKGVGMRWGEEGFKGKPGAQYLFIKAPDGSYHVFTEVVAKRAARDCGATQGNTRTMCEQVLGF